jgi:hypothetical protein
MKRDPSDIRRYKSGIILLHCHLFSPIPANYRLFDDFARTAGFNASTVLLL